MEEYNPSAEGNEPDNRAEELKRFKMTPGIEEARAAINERFSYIWVTKNPANNPSLLDALASL